MNPNSQHLRAEI